MLHSCSISVCFLQGLHLIHTNARGDRAVQSLPTSNTVISTGMTVPIFSCVAALYSLQNCMIFTPCQQCKSVNCMLRQCEHSTHVTCKQSQISK